MVDELRLIAVRMAESDDQACLLVLEIADRLCQAIDMPN
jgi:hypothetical protein